MKSSRALLFAATALAFAGGQRVKAAPVTASADVAPADSAAAGVSEIIVTAEKRSENVQSVPISIQVYSGQNLVSRGVTNIRELSAIDPSINEASSGGQPVLSIRGVQNSNATETGEPAVQVATDGIFNDRPYSLTAMMYDIDRIEVLRGPQGTLFGRNTTGGLVSIVTNHPTSTQEGGVNLEFGNYNAEFVDGYYNLPLSDQVQVRASFSARNRDGYRNNPPLGQHGDDEHDNSERLQVAWEPTPSLKLWVAGMYTHEGGIGEVGELDPFVFIPGTNPKEPVHQLPPTISDGTTFPITTNIDQHINTTDVKWSLTDDVLPFGTTLTYLGGYNHIDYTRPVPLPIPGLPSDFVRNEHPTTYNDEVRLSSPDSQRLIWQVGAFYYEEDSNLYTDFISNAGSAIQQIQYYFLDPKIFDRSVAGFGQATFKATSKLKLTVGARYTADWKVRVGSQYYPVGSLFIPGGAAMIGNQDGSTYSAQPTWLVDLDYTPQPDHLIYAKASTGYKSGGFTSGIEYKPEDVLSYEVGTKNEFFDHRLQVDAAGYYMDYTNQQITQYLVLCTGCAATSVVTNAGRSQIYGIESNVIAVVDPIGRLDFAANYLHAQFQNYLAVQPWNNVNVQLAGHTLPTSPRWSLSAALEHDWKDVAGGTITGRVNVKYTSTEYFTPFNFPDDTQGPVTLVDALLSYTPDHGSWQVQAYMNNMGNVKRFISMGEAQGLGYGFSYGAPRTFGARLNVHF